MINQAGLLQTASNTITAALKLIGCDVEFQPGLIKFETFFKYVKIAKTKLCTNAIADKEC